MNRRPGKTGPTPAQIRAAFRVFFKGLLLLILLLAAARAMLNDVADRAVSKALRRLEADGYAICPERMAPAPLPPEQNAALLYEAALREFSSLHAQDYPIRMVQDLELADKEPILEELRNNASVFAKLREARRRPGCRFERDYRQAFGGNYRELSAAADLAWAMALQALEQAGNGRQDEARETLRDLLSMAAAYRSEPLARSQEIWQVLLETAVQALAGCSRSCTTESDLSEWLDVLPRPESVATALEFSLRGQLAASACFVSDPVEMLEGFQRPRWDGAERIVFRLLEPLIRLKSLDSLHRMRGSIEDCHNPYSRAYRRAVTEHVLHERPALDLLRILQESSYRQLDPHYLLAASLAVTRAGLEAELRFVREGRYPDQIRTLDPFSGRRLTYDAEEGIISSFGPADGELYPGWFEEKGLVWRLLPR